MSGITSYGAYLPLWRLSREAIGREWGQPAPPGEKAVANYDEDSITMAVAASTRCLKGLDRQAVDGCLRFLDDHRVLVEPSCGAVLAAIYDRCSLLRELGPVLVEVCGGAGVSWKLLHQWDRQAG